MTDTAPTQTTQEEKGSRRMTIGLILVSVTLAAIAQVTLKAGMNHVTDANGGQLALSGDSLKQIADPGVGLGRARDLRGLGGALAVRAVAREPLVRLSVRRAGLRDHRDRVDPVPRTSTCSRLTWVGVALIVGGILLIAQGSPQG